MSMVAFFPWIRLDEIIVAGEFQLVPFKRGQAPGPPDQPALDALLKPYVHGKELPVEFATLIRLSEKGITSDLSDEDRASLFGFSELVAFSGLARREFFTKFNYVNRDDFTFVIQAFKEAGSGVAVTARRRDGVTQAYVVPTAYRVHRPFHVNNVDMRVQIDKELLLALVNARSRDAWPRYEEAILSFNRANTDGDQVSEQAEAVHMVGAIERLLDCRRGRENEFVSSFLGRWVPTSSLLPSACRRIPPNKARRRSVTEIWLRDFYTHRGNLGHGKTRSGHRWIWPLGDHLLLGAFVFPLLARLVLSTDGLYRLTLQDEADIDAFELLATTGLEPLAKDDDEPTRFAWTQVRAESHGRRRWAEIVSHWEPMQATTLGEQPKDVTPDQATH